MNELNTLVSRLKETAEAQGFGREAEDDVFQLIAEQACDQCCQVQSGGTPACDTSAAK